MAMIAASEVWRLLMAMVASAPMKKMAIVASATMTRMRSLARMFTGLASVVVRQVVRP